MLNITVPARSAATAIRDVGAALLDAFVSSVRPLVARTAMTARHVAVITPDGLVLYALRKGGIGEGFQLATGARAPDAFRSGEVQLRLPPELFLTRTLRLPDAGRSYLEPIIAHRLERLTPWRADKVLYGYSVVDGVSEDGTIGVELLATSIDLASPHIARLEAAGLSVTSLGSAAEPLDAPLRFDLYKDRAQATDGRLRSGTGRYLAIILAVLAAACLVSTVLATSAEADLQDTEQRLATLRSKLASRDGGTSRERTLIEAKRPDSATIVLIDKLSKALPDGTVLRELDIDPTRIRLVGRSTDAPALIERLEAEAGLKNLRFAAPVIRDADKRDAFDLIATRSDATGTDGSRRSR
ncbi:PilN domain-containing protein [Methylobacterium iners]|uniref:Fimbrial assembly protein n=1 Tax=Methylobacterium iners TaxID=418707 RepID=A0ABQ4S366_9HYPH|nr:PilN domain-containing protein [Methylobacterium iners]GJD96617.1 hypothetical protein OCOJLMKI_3840 [Methylobacterium iners]